MKSKVLVIIRHFGNRKRLLLRALQSVENQTYKNHEVYILSMSSSTDDNLKKGLLHPNVHTIFSDQHAVFFAEMQSSSADKIAFLDDDDTWAPEFLTRLISVYENRMQGLNAVKAICCHVNKVNEVSEGNRIIINTTLPFNHYLPTGPINFDALYYKNSIPISSVIFSKDEFLVVAKEHNVFNPAFYWVFLIDFISAYDLWLVPESMSYYHFRDANDSYVGNYSILQDASNEFEFTLNLHGLMRRKDNTQLLNMLLNMLVNKTKHHRLTYLENKINGN